MEKSLFADKTEVEQAVKLAVRHIKQWTLKELQKLLEKPRPRTQYPIIVALNDQGYLIGNYAILKHKKEWQLIYRYNDTVLSFYDHKPAIFYALCCQTNQVQIADRIYNYDQSIGRLRNKAEQFKIRLESCQKTKNKTQSSEMFVSRYQQTRSQIKLNQVLLEKTYKLTKYYNL